MNQLNSIFKHTSAFRNALSFLLVFYSGFGFSQKDSLSFFERSSTFNKCRFNSVVISEAALLTGSFVGLQQLWYKEHQSGSFHFFNDFNEWEHVDKVGHLFSCYQISRVGIDLMRWSGADKKQTAIYGASAGLIYLSGVEILDGFSTGWGFSITDMGANIIGTGLAVGQHLAWQDQRINFKYSFRRSDYYTYRPNLLGSDLTENLLKDYNAQTYWMSFNMKSLMNLKSFPGWLNLAIGYGADGMITGEESEIGYPMFNRYRQYYLSLDVDLTRIKTNSVFFNTVLSTFNCIKFPFPALEYNRIEGLKGHYLGF